MPEKKCPNCGLINHPTAQRCDCGYDFDSEELKKSYLTPGIERLTGGLREKALKRIGSAFWAAVILVIINLALQALAIARAESPGGAVYVRMADPLVMLILAVWMYTKKSVVAAALLLVMFLIGKIVLLALLMGVAVTTAPEHQPRLWLALGRQLPWLLIFGCFFVNGIRGTATYQRMMVEKTRPE